MRPSLCLLHGLLLAPIACQPVALEPATAENLLLNGGFEQWHEATPDDGGLVSGWRLGRPPLAVEQWALNKAYPGELLRGETDPADGAHHVTLRKTGSRNVHLYQMLSELQRGAWYRLRARVRGGEMSAWAYEYDATGPPVAVGIARGRAPAAQWREAVGYYQVPSEGWRRSALALVLDGSERVDLDDVSLEPVTVPSPARDAPDVVLENDAARLVLSPSGVLRQLRSKGSGTEYLGDAPQPIVHVVHRGNRLQSSALSRTGDRLEFRFPEPEVRLMLEVAGGPRHFRFEVLDFSPDDLDSVHVSLPLRRLEKIGRAFNATYDDEFGLSLFGTTVTARSSFELGPRGTLLPSVSAGSRHGIRGAGLALVTATRPEFKAAIMEAERASGLPCPMLDGKWARDSDSVRSSYLFANPVAAADIDTLIEYAKVGGFATIVFLNESWLANHGHFDINTETFPRGLADVREAVRKIHRAGLQAGVHVHGPSISPNDPYITPVPDRRLATVPCPPLAGELDEQATTVAFTSPPPLPPRTWEHAAFPGRFLRIGDEIIAYDEHEDGPPFRFVDVQRGALGTKVTRHPAGSEIAGLPALRGYFLVDPDSTLADELTGNFAGVFNEAGFDFVYFDSSDGTGEPYIDTWYYMGKLHLGFYRKLERDVLYQTSLGTGRGILWHFVPRSASADGFADIKRYLDERWETVLDMEDDLTRADVGWYRWYGDVRPDEMEYVNAKVAGVDGSFSLETDRKALERVPQSRQMLEMVGRWEHCRKARAFPDDVRGLLREPGKDFKLFVGGERCDLYRAVYEEPRVVDALDLRQSVWTIDNERPQSSLLGIEIVRGEDDDPTQLPQQVQGGPVVTVNDRSFDFGVELRPGEAITTDGVGPAMLWSRNMAPGRPLRIRGLPMTVRPGRNTVALSWEPAHAFPGGVEIRLYRLWPIQDPFRDSKGQIPPGNEEVR